MKITDKLYIPVAFLALGFSILSMSLQQQAKPKPWNVPDEFRDMMNPVPATPMSINSGSALYKKHCISCHGKTGLGDGVKAPVLSTFPGDFSGPAYHTQTDGEHFYKTKYGRGEMPSHEGKFSDEEIWHLVNYMHTFKK